MAIGYPGVICAAPFVTRELMWAGKLFLSYHIQINHATTRHLYSFESLVQIEPPKDRWFVMQSNSSK